MDATNKALDDIEFPISDWSRIKHIFEFDYVKKSSWYKGLPLIKAFYKDSQLTDLQYSYDILVNFIVCHEHVLESMKKHQRKDLMKKIEFEALP